MKSGEKPSRRSIGNHGEIVAVRYLQEKGLQILDTNYTIQGGEIDIIARDHERIIFFEVRYRYDASHGHPLDTFTHYKKIAMKRAIMHYLMKHRIDESCIRVDFIGLMPRSAPTGGHRIWWIRGIEL